MLYVVYFLYMWVCVCVLNTVFNCVFVYGCRCHIDGYFQYNIEFVCRKSNFDQEFTFFRPNSSNRQPIQFNPFSEQFTHTKYWNISTKQHQKKHMMIFSMNKKTNKLVDKPLTRLLTIYTMQFISPLANIN